MSDSERALAVLDRLLTMRQGDVIHLQRQDNGFVAVWVTREDGLYKLPLSALETTTAAALLDLGVRLDKGQAE